jgi:hypothetical protein
MKGVLISIVGVGLLVVGVVNAILMFEVLGGPKGAKSLREVHRWLGWIFVVVFVLFFIFMLPRAAHFGSFPVFAVLHAFVGMTLLPIVVAKPLVARRYKTYMGSMPELGFIILVGTFVLIMLSGGHMLIEALVK